MFCCWCWVLIIKWPNILDPIFFIISFSSCASRHLTSKHFLPSRRLQALPACVAQAMLCGLQLVSKLLPAQRLSGACWAWRFNKFKQQVLGAIFANIGREDPWLTCLSEGNKSRTVWSCVVQLWLKTFHPHGIRLKIWSSLHGWGHSHLLENPTKIFEN